MYKYITNYVFKLFSLGHLIQIESDSFIWILDLGCPRATPYISTDVCANKLRRLYLNSLETTPQASQPLVCTVHVLTHVPVGIPTVRGYRTTRDTRLASLNHNQRV